MCVCIYTHIYSVTSGRGALSDILWTLRADCEAPHFGSILATEMLLYEWLPSMCLRDQRVGSKLNK